MSHTRDHASRHTDGSDNIAVATTGITGLATGAHITTLESALQDVADDTTPQLGGTLDMNGNDIQSATTGGAYVQAAAGSATDPVFGIKGDETTGIGYKTAGSAISIISSGVQVAEFDTAQVDIIGVNLDLNNNSLIAATSLTDGGNADAQHVHEGTAIKSTGITGTTNFLRADGDGTSSFQTVPGSTSTLSYIIDGGGSAITTGIKGDLEIPFACTINQVTMLADQSGSIVVDIWKDTYANYPPTDADSITASAVPTITTATKSQDATLTGWTTSITAGDTLRYNVDSVTTIERVTISLKVTRS